MVETVYSLLIIIINQFFGGGSAAAAALCRQFVVIAEILSAEVTGPVILAVARVAV